jgi:hypothetical protein
MMFHFYNKAARRRQHSLKTYWTIQCSRMLKYNIVYECSHSRLGHSFTGFEVLTAMVTESSFLWVITPCNSLKVNQRFGGTCSFHLQGRRIIQAAYFMLFPSLSYSSSLQIKAKCYPKRRLIFNERRYVPEDTTLLNSGQVQGLRGKKIHCSPLLCCVLLDDRSYMNSDETHRIELWDLIIRFRL